MDSLGSKLLSRSCVQCHEVWVGSQHISALTFSFPIYTLGTSTPWWLNLFWKLFFFPFTKSYRCLIPPHSFPNMISRSFQPLFVLLIQTHKKIFARKLSPGFVFLLSLNISTVAIILELDVFTSFNHIWGTSSTYNLEWKS